MKRHIFPWLFLLLSIIAQASVTVFPLSMIVFLLWYLHERTDLKGGQTEIVFLTAFFVGLLLDMLTFRILGLTSLFLVSFLFVLSLYERKFEINTIPFVLLTAFGGVSSFMLFFGHDHALTASFVGTLIAVVGFVVLSFMTRKITRQEARHMQYYK